MHGTPESGQVLPSPLRYIDRFARREMGKWSVPGFAYGIVKGDRLVHARGLGVRNVRSGLPVTADTLFSVASTTKAFTATAAGILVEQGKLDLDKPVRAYVPDFRLDDRVATEHVTTRDLLCHRTGVARHDLVWWGTRHSRRDLLRRLRYLESTHELRQHFLYNNLMYMVAGIVIEEISGMPWEDFVRQHILEPLGMDGADFFSTTLYRRPDMAVGHREIGGGFRPVAPNQCPAVGPAGTLCASIGDMCKWVAMNLNGGAFGGRQVVAARILEEIQSPQMAMPGIPAQPEFLPSSYALGWTVSAYRGELWVHHAGGINDTLTQVCLLPRTGAGIVLAANASHYEAGALIGIVERRVMDGLLGLPPIPWSRRIRTELVERQAKERRDREEELAASRDRVETSPPRALADYAGIYEHPGYGPLVVRLRDGKLRGEFHKCQFSLRHTGKHTFHGYGARSFGQPDQVRFRAGTGGHIASITASLAGIDVCFRRQSRT